jgi:hypothetical protein
MSEFRRAGPQQPIWSHLLAGALGDLRLEIDPRDDPKPFGRKRLAELRFDLGHASPHPDMYRDAIGHDQTIPSGSERELSMGAPAARTPPATGVCMVPSRHGR